MVINSKEYKARLASLSTALRVASGSSIIVLPAASDAIKTHDQSYGFFQDRDFLYFTGLKNLENAVLILSSELKKPGTLLVAKRTAKQKLWDGPGHAEEAKAATRALGLNLVEVENLSAETQRAIAGFDTVYLNSARSNFALKIAQWLLAKPHYELQSAKLPSTIAHSQTLTAPLRAVKSELEIQLIRNAVSLTESALIEVLRVTHPGYSELHLAKLFEGLVREAGGNLAFNSIVAGGPNAGVLHHSPSARKLKKGELVLFDVGAELEGYNGDISRTVSLSAPAHLDKLLTYVDRAQGEIAKLLKIGAAYQEIKLKAVNIVAEQLAKCGIPVRGSAKGLVKSEEIKKFFPHNFGHSLGLDVHDPLPADAKLKAGMVFTVEPGLYLSKKIGNYPALGIRIEDDFFVSKSGPKIFSSIPQLISL